MDATELLGIVERQWTSALPDKKIEVLQETRKLVPNELLGFFDALIDSKLAGIQNDPEAKIVILVHGIQTDGAWHKLVESQFKSLPHTSTIGIGYEFYTALQLFSPFRQGPIKKVLREIRDIKSLSPNARLLVIAHSFGTYIVSKILSGSSDIRFDKVILCGSIVPRDFRWDIYLPALNSKSIINDAGTDDVWPIVATAVSFGYGASGQVGFGTTRVTDRFFRYKHSDYFTEGHINKYWTPFVSGGTIVDSEWDSIRIKNSDIVGALTNKWIAKIIIVLACYTIYKAFEFVYFKLGLNSALASFFRFCTAFFVSN